VRKALIAALAAIGIAANANASHSGVKSLPKEYSEWEKRVVVQLEKDSEVRELARELAYHCRLEKLKLLRKIAARRCLEEGVGESAVEWVASKVETPKWYKESRKIIEDKLSTVRKEIERIALKRPLTEKEKKRLKELEQEEVKLNKSLYWLDTVLKMGRKTVAERALYKLLGGGR